MTDFDAPWYHGSPLALNALAIGSVVTPFREIAKAFAHKPTLVSMSDDFSVVKHDGSTPGFLYVIDERVQPADLAEMPGTDGTHWQTKRELRVVAETELPVSDPPQLTAEQIRDIKRGHPQAASSGFYSTPARDGGNGNVRS